MDAVPRLFADERGIWRESVPAGTSGISWSVIYSVSGYKLDGVTTVYTCVVLDFVYGEFIELYHHWPGFGQVVAAITECLPEIDRDWFSQLEQLRIGDAPLEVWHRAETDIEDAARRDSG